MSCHRRQMDVEEMVMMKMRIGAMWLMGLLTVAVAVMLTGMFHAGTASAAMGDASDTGRSLGIEAGGTDHVPNVRPLVVESGGRMKVIWSATLTVEEASDRNSTVWGYYSMSNESLGNLDDTTFRDRNVDYTIDSLIYKEVGIVKQLVLETSTGLHDDLIFEVDGERYALSDADARGQDEDIHVWWLDSALEWEDGETKTVKLLRAQASKPGSASATSESGVGFRLREVWAATLTVGGTAKEESGVLGYQSGGSDEFGSLEGTTFTDMGTKYNAGRLVHKPVGDEHYLLNIATGRALDPNMVFEVDGEQYAVLDSSPGENGEAAHGWLLDSSLGWSEGDTMTVKVLRFEFYRRAVAAQAQAHAGG